MNFSSRNFIGYTDGIMENWKRMREREKEREKKKGIRIKIPFSFIKNDFLWSNEKECRTVCLDVAFGSFCSLISDRNRFSDSLPRGRKYFI